MGIEVLLTRSVGRVLLSGILVAMHVQNPKGITTPEMKTARR